MFICNICSEQQQRCFLIFLAFLRSLANNQRARRTNSSSSTAVVAAVATPLAFPRPPRQRSVSKLTRPFFVPPFSFLSPSLRCSLSLSLRLTTTTQTNTDTLFWKTIRRTLKLCRRSRPRCRGLHHSLRHRPRPHPPPGAGRRRPSGRRSVLRRGQRSGLRARAGGVRRRSRPRHGRPRQV